VQGDNVPDATGWQLTLDLFSARVLVWIASFGRAADLTPEAHLYFADRYHRLASDQILSTHTIHPPGLDVLDNGGVGDAVRAVAPPTHIVRSGRSRGCRS
jgi:hypothetical protein